MTNVNGNYKQKLKKTFKKISKKTTREQRFLGKTLPRAIGGLAKFAFKHPISATALAFVPSAIKKVANTQKGLKFPKFRQFDKRGRKII
tara:strand:- start:1695 stop:1961 length:267 start_codon:yes stop_codon:yes gene_type:complete